MLPAIGYWRPVSTKMLFCIIFPFLERKAGAANFFLRARFCVKYMWFSIFWSLHSTCGGLANACDVTANESLYWRKRHVRNLANVCYQVTATCFPALRRISMKMCLVKRWSFLLCDSLAALALPSTLFKTLSFNSKAMAMFSSRILFILIGRHSKWRPCCVK